MFEFLTQPQNVVVDDASKGIVFVAPDFIEQLIARDDESRILNQVFTPPHVLTSFRLVFANRETIMCERCQRISCDNHDPKPSRMRNTPLCNDAMDILEDLLL